MIKMHNTSAKDSITELNPEDENLRAGGNAVLFMFLGNAFIRAVGILGAAIKKLI